MSDVAPVLIIDDHEDARESLQDVLRLEGYAVTGAGDGLEGLERLRTSPAPCLILLDLMMPRMDGWEFRRRQLADPRLRSIPVVVISAVADLPAGATDLSALAYLSKPVDYSVLIEMVQRNCCPVRQ